MTSKLSSILLATAAILPIEAHPQKASDPQFFLSNQEWTEFSKVEAISSENSKGQVGIVIIRTRDRVNITCNYGSIGVEETGKPPSVFEVTAQHCTKNSSDGDVLITPTLKTLLEGEGKSTSYQRKPDPIALSAFDSTTIPYGLLVSVFVSVPGANGDFRDFKITGPIFPEKNGNFKLNLIEKDYNHLLSRTAQGALYGISGSLVRDPNGNGIGIIIQSSREGDLKHSIVIQPLVQSNGTIQITE